MSRYGTNYLGAILCAIAGGILGGIIAKAIVTFLVNFLLGGFGAGFFGVIGFIGGAYFGGAFGWGFGGTLSGKALALVIAGALLVGGVISNWSGTIKPFATSVIASVTGKVKSPEGITMPVTKDAAVQVVKDIAAQVTKGDATTTSDIRLFARPSNVSDVIKTIKTGETVTVTGKLSNGWLPIKHDGSKGWASAQYIEQE